MRATGLPGSRNAFGIRALAGPPFSGPAHYLPHAGANVAFPTRHMAAIGPIARSFLELRSPSSGCFRDEKPIRRPVMDARNPASAADTRNPVSTANLMGHPLHPILITLPIGLFIATFLCDLLYWTTAEAAFATAAIWLLGFGLLAAALAAVAGLIDFLNDRRIRDISDAWQHAIGNVILILLQLFSFYYRYRYGASAVVPVGLSL